MGCGRADRIKKMSTRKSNEIFLVFFLKSTEPKPKKILLNNLGESDYMNILHLGSY